MRHYSVGLTEIVRHVFHKSLNDFLLIIHGY